jgi:hypothetical protein
MSSLKHSGIRATKVIANSIRSPDITRLNSLMKLIFINGPNNGTNFQINPIFIEIIAKRLTPIITESVIKNLCDLGCIESPCCYYYTNDCCGDNNVKDLNIDLNKILNSFNIDDNEFSLLSTEIIEDITSNNSEQIESIESFNNEEDNNENNNENNDENNNI